MTDPTSAADETSGDSTGDSTGHTMADADGAETPPVLSQRMTRTLAAVMCLAHLIFTVAVTLLAPVVRAASDPRAAIAPSGPALLGLFGVAFGALVFVVALWYPAAEVLRRVGVVVLVVSTVVVLGGVALTAPVVGAVYGAEVAFLAVIAAVLVKLPKAPDAGGPGDVAADAPDVSR
jgi:hypothetical protein